MRLPPMAIACLSVIAIDCCSNIIAQGLQAWNESKPFVFDRLLFIQFTIMVVLAAPINYHWQNWLERAFPGWKMVKQRREVGVGDEEKEIMLTEDVDVEDEKIIEEDVKVRNWVNIFKNWFMDCITLGALMNQAIFLIVMGLLKGKKIGLIMEDCRNELLGLILDSYKIWPIAKFFSVTYVPVERRVVFLSLCGMLWKIYLSLVAARL